MTTRKPANKATPGGVTQTPTALTEGETLRAWAIANPKAPAWWILVAHRLADDADMPLAWASLRKRKDRFGDPAFPQPLAVLADVHNAIDRAAQEAKRETTDQEARKLDAVKAAARGLKDAIAASPLPRDHAHGPFDLVRIESNGDRDVVPIVIGWRDVREDGYGMAHPLDISALMDVVVDLVDRHTRNLPPRSMTRKSDRAFVAAFVRWLNWLFLQRCDGGMQATIARLTNAALDLKDPLDANDVKGIVRDAPKAFREGPKRSRRGG